MITVELNDEQDALMLFDKFVGSDKSGAIYARHSDNCVTVTGEQWQDVIAFASSVLSDYVMGTREEEMLLELIRSTFYFQDKDEQEQILAVAKSIMQGKKTDLPGLKKISSRREVLIQAFCEFLDTETTFHYESFIRFRLKPYRECLQRYVEMAIDEYKLEQEYQNFVESLRKLLTTRRPLLDTIHLVFQREFAIYDREYQRIDEQNVREHLDPVLGQRWGMDIEPSVLVTLIGIAPRNVFLYTDNVDAGMIQTIQNVFQERVIICPARSCDFHSF
ncbi:MAG TPA: putative sporulation protein YtxC [Bacillales bacterium]